jgi:hypothetical protein
VELLENRLLLAGGVTDDGVPTRAASVSVVFSSDFIPEINVVGNERSIVEGDTTPDLLDLTDFGAVEVDGQVITRTFRIENTGTGTLNLTGSPRVEISGANAGDFTVTLQPPESIDAGNSRQFTIEFNPGAEGVRTATISIPNNDGDENRYEFNIHGTGAATRDPLDINRDGRVSALDALAIINQINRTFANQEESSAENVDQALYDYDANGDGKVSTLDALLVINHVRSGVDGGAPPPTHETCLAQAGPLVTLSGSQSDLANLNVEPKTKFDATNATWYATSDTRIELSGDNLCWHGGLVEHNWPADQDWNTTHDDHAFKISSSNLVIENVQIKTAGDGISMYEGTDNFLVRGVYMEDIRDDAIEHDWLAGGTIEDTLINGAYVAFAARSRDSGNVDGSSNTWIIKDTLAWLRPQVGVYKGTSPGHGGFFKWEQTDNAPMLSLHNNIFMVGQKANHQDLGVPQGKLIDASNNIVVWLGEGDYPDPLPAGFTITTDRSVWDNAVADWMSRHQSVSATASEVTDNQSSINSASYTATVDTGTVDTATVDTATVDTLTSLKAPADVVNLAVTEVIVSPSPQRPRVNLGGDSLLPPPVVQALPRAIDVGSDVTRSSGSEESILLDWSEWQLESDLVELLAEDRWSWGA